MPANHLKQKERERERKEKNEEKSTIYVVNIYNARVLTNNATHACRLEFQFFGKLNLEKKEREMNINTCPHVKMEKKKIIYLCLEINTTTRESYERFQGMVIHGRIQPKSQ